MFASILFFVTIWPSGEAALLKTIGFDFGTSGVRCIGIDDNKNIIYENAMKWNDPTFTGLESEVMWSSALRAMMTNIPKQHRATTERICISGTSASALIFDVNKRKVSRRPRMYDYNVFSNPESITHIDNIKAYLSRHCPPRSPANAPTSTLPKLLLWHCERRLAPSERLCHQADYLASLLLQDPAEGDYSFTSDWHSALKLGYDVANEEYPEWLLRLLGELGYDSPMAFVLPPVVRPGSVVGPVTTSLRATYGLPASCCVVAGTTDSIAAFLASGAARPGQAVSSLGSTLAVKLLSTTAVEDSSRGIYSHRLGDLWLVGGASNTGCAVLRSEGYSDEDLARLSQYIDPSRDSPLRYYPLAAPGERFPVSDPHKPPVLYPKPVSSASSGDACCGGESSGEESDVPVSDCPDTRWRARYLHGLLQGIAEVEREGYAALASLGASPVTEVITSGGGARNDVWTALRGRILGVPTRCGALKSLLVLTHYYYRKADNVEAAYGCALLALNSLQ